MPPWAAYLIVFVASACTLILELVAGRILAPFIGVSLYTWTSIIGVVLAGISVGNYLGGRIADQWPSRSTLGILLATGGIASLAILPLIGIVTTFSANGMGGLIDPNSSSLGGVPVDRALLLILRIVLVTTFIFLPPSLILGMVSPVVIKLVLSDLSHTGGVVGKIYAISTLGSILGTFATGFFLVQILGTRMIVLSVGLVLLAVGLLLLAIAAMRGERLRAAKAVAPIAILGVIVAAVGPVQTALAYQCLGDRPAFELGVGDCLGRSATDGWRSLGNSGCLRETAYYCIKVQDEVVTLDHPIKTLVLDHLIHSYNSLDDPSYLKYDYIKVYAEVADYLARRLPNQDLRVLYIGGGGYTLPRHIEATYPNAKQEVVEIDPGVTQTDYEEMGVNPATTKIVTYNYDARLVLDTLANERAGQYDLIIGDAFNDLSIPYHLTTLEFDQKIRRLLKSDGYYLVLVIDKLRGGKFITAYTQTLDQVWPETYLLNNIPSWDSTSASTYVVAASNETLDQSRFLLAQGQGQDGRHITNFMPPDLMAQWLADAHSPILTDDYAPVDNLIAPIFADRGF
jgi:spermidine synthase